MKNISLSLLSCLLLWFAAPIEAGSADSTTTERRNEHKPLLKSVKDTRVTTQAYQSHVWFHSVDVFISGDLNDNGYYHRLEVELDADTSVSYQQVFAEFTLLPTYGDERVYYTSSVFELYGQSPDDWLAIDTVLENRFAPDDYLLTVRLFNAATGYLLAEISGFDDANLDYIPLEDYNRDSYIGSSTTVEASGGATGILLLLVLCLLSGQRYRALRQRS
jgi:hypothetical protein